LASMEKINAGVYRIISRIPRGKVSTYKEVARSMGLKSCRLIGRALALNPDAPAVPCHRIVKSDGSVGGYSGPGGIPAKEKLLRKEGVPVHGGKVENFDKYFFRIRR